MDNWDVIIVGAGYGGLCTGALLANKGKKVLVLEKGNSIGGLAASVNYAGQILDDGAHIPLLVGHIEGVFSDLGIPFPEYTLVNKCEFYHENQWTDIKNIFPFELYKKALDVMLRLTPEEITKLDDLPLNEWVNTISDDPSIHKLFFYFGCVTSVGNRYNTYSAGEMLYILKEVIESGRVMSETGGVVKGGMNSLLQPLADFIENHGGEVKLNTPVESVEIKDGRAIGVNIETGSRLFHSQVLDIINVKAESVIVTLPLWDIFSVLDEADFPNWWTDWINWLGNKVGHVWNVMYSVDEPPFDTNMFRFVESMPRTGYAAIFFSMPTYGDEVNQNQFHICYQGHYDEYPDLFNRKNAGVRKKTREILALMEQESLELFPQVKNAYNWRVAHAAIYSITQSPGFVGYKRPSMKLPGVSNIYLVSSNVREARGIGIAAVAKCSQLAVSDIISK